MDEIMAFDTYRSNNAFLMNDCHKLGYLEGRVVDVTYGTGRFWRNFTSDTINLTASDINPPTDNIEWFPVYQADFTQLPFDEASFDTVVFDPPYKLNGTSTGAGPAALDDGYGVGGAYTPVQQLNKMIYDGIVEAARVLKSGGWLLLKCQGQQSSGVYNDQPGFFAGLAEDWFVERDRLHVVTPPRKQPRPQKTARCNYSTLVVLQRRKRKATK